MSYTDCDGKVVHVHSLAVCDAVDGWMDTNGSVPYLPFFFFFFFFFFFWMLAAGHTWIDGQNV